MRSGSGDEAAERGIKCEVIDLEQFTPEAAVAVVVVVVAAVVVVVVVVVVIDMTITITPEAAIAEGRVGFDIHTHAPAPKSFTDLNYVPICSQNMLYKLWWAWAWV